MTKRQRLAKAPKVSTLKPLIDDSEVNMSEESLSLFSLLILSLGNAALIGIGLVPDPATNISAVNLDLTRHNIELLAMLQEKSKGNLSFQEQQLLDDLLYDLRLKFVDAKRGVC